MSDVPVQVPPELRERIGLFLTHGHGILESTVEWAQDVRSVAEDFEAALPGLSDDERERAAQAAGLADLVALARQVEDAAATVYGPHR